MNAAVSAVAFSPSAARAGAGRVDQPAILRLLRRLQQQRRIGRRVLRLVLADGIDVAGVGDDHGVALERFEQGHALQA